ncbi:MAG: hypothetical protein WBG62_23770 [Cyclobacteriaceae bacterium]
MVENGLGITWEWSPWLLPLCMVAGALFAWLLYRRSADRRPWGRTVNITLAVLRFLIVTFLCLLLLGPLVRMITRSEEPPVWVLAIDNSLSVSETTDSVGRTELTSKLDELSRELEESGSQVVVRTLDAGNGEDEVQYTAPQSDINAMLRGIQNDYEGRNLAGVLLVSDGIYNRGMSPAYSPYTFPIYTVGVGDTIPRADINLQNTYVNKVAYQGNRFPLVAEVFNQGMTPRNLDVTVSRNGKVLDTKQVNFENDREVKQVRFLMDATEEGMQHYVVSVAAVDGEFTEKNNRKDVFVDIVKGKQKILIAAASPHPDIKAIRSALETNQNYEVSLYIPGLQEANLRERYDVVILHQLPVRNNAVLQEITGGQQNNKPGLWYIVGPGSDIPALSQQVRGMEMSVVPNQTDEVMPVLNTSFRRFTLSPRLQETLDDFTPLTIPLGRYNLKKNTEVLLNQRVGSVTTSRPLLTIYENQGQKEAVLLGTGLWRWRMAEFSSRQEHEGFNELVVKTVQYLSTREDRRKFRVFTTSTEFLESEPVVFEAQLYNDVYERVYGQEINLKITSENDSLSQYTFSTSESSSRYRVGGLPAGVYDYTATTTFNGEGMQSSGQFSIADLQVETLNLTANFGLLRKIARSSGAAFYPAGDLEALSQHLSEQDAPAILHAEEQRRSIMDMPWLMALFILLISAEWALRRYHGSY